LAKSPGSRPKQQSIPSRTPPMFGRIEKNALCLLGGSQSASAAQLLIRENVPTNLVPERTKAADRMTQGGLSANTITIKGENTGETYTRRLDEYPMIE